METCYQGQEGRCRRVVCVRDRVSVYSGSQRQGQAHRLRAPAPAVGSLLVVGRMKRLEEVFKGGWSCRRRCASVAHVAAIGAFWWYDGATSQTARRCCRMTAFDCERRPNAERQTPNKRKKKEKNTIWRGQPITLGSI